MRLLAFLCILFLAASASAQPFEANALRALVAEAASMDEWTPVVGPDVVTYDGYAELHSVVLEQGGDYLFVVSTLSGEGLDPDVSVEDPDFDAFLLEDGPGETETARFVAGPSGPYVFSVEMAGCEPSACRYAFALYRK